MPFPIWPIIFSIIFRASRSWFTSWTVVPDPFAIRCRRKPSIECGTARSRGVIERTIASTRLSRSSSTSAFASCPIPGIILRIPCSGPIRRSIFCAERKSSKVN